MTYPELVMHKLKGEHEYIISGEVGIFESDEDINVICAICKEQVPKPM